MKKKIGVLLILLSFIVTFICWKFTQPLKPISIIRQYSELIAALSLIGFAWVNFISTRHSILDEWFNGLDKTYIYHKYLSIISLILAILHQLSVKSGGRVSRDYDTVQKISEGPRNSVGHIFVGFGSISMFLFIALVIFALVAKKLNYERWKLIHKVMFVPYIIGLATSV